MEIPTISRLSGTMPEDLLKDYIEAKTAVENALRTLSGVWPHGRDYQQGSINKAMHEHAERCKQLHQVAGELQVIAEGISNQL
jgi:hypothetical protein